MIVWETEEPAEPDGLGGLVVVALIPVPFVAAALLVASLVSNDISLTTLILGTILAALIAFAMIALYVIGPAAGEPVNGTIGLLTILTTGISMTGPLGPKNGEPEVRQRLKDCEAHIAALKKSAR